LDATATAELRAALTEEHLLVYAQPIIDQRRGTVAQQELLVRLQSLNGDGRVLSPGEFLPQVERSGLIGIVDRWMVAHGLALARDGRSAQVNISPRSMDDPALADELATELGALGASASNLVFEITETAAVANFDASRAFAERVVKLGARIALDDFGTGFGSLTYLRHLPVEFLKIDRSFIGDLAASSDSQAMVRAIVAMARELGVMTIAEGIEDDATLSLLREYDVDYVQGYLLGRPAPLRRS
jgi:EAL domain-containing protein (putative c-di-GMP-specific phosphodiesterase class I)